jgi:hypothetical protein
MGWRGGRGNAGRFLTGEENARHNKKYSEAELYLLSAATAFSHFNPLFEALKRTYSQRILTSI